MKYSELDKLAEKHGWTKIRDDDYWLLFTKNNINIEICKHRIDNDILLWAETSEGEINLNDELDFINACIELGNTPLADREDEEENIDLIIHRLKEIQTNVEDVMNWKTVVSWEDVMDWMIKEIENRDIRNSLGDIIIDLEEYRKARSVEGLIKEEQKSLKSY